ncbi:MAG: YabP/YqfC family sporulation protein [Muribaculaceae bacterium]|nr:YabP/YqfC family sporulation protein [Anaeroplasma bactoclasticum]MCM1296272.1 YabP/YqfC family sporulation protein [Muribaculaceae bacterium]MCM1556390.1 YabP/YqfC family sporulation protein [Anaeroplasma bactoclasticum]
MSNINFTIYDDQIIVNNITEIKEFSETIFVLRVNDIPYEITGTNLILKEVSNDNKTIKITGTLNSLEKKNVQVKKNKSFLRKLFA